MKTLALIFCMFATLAHGQSIFPQALMGQSFISNGGGGIPNIVADYYFNGDFTDSSGQGNNASGVNSPSFTTGQDGISNHSFVSSATGPKYVDAGLIANFTSSDFSVSIWFKSTSSGNLAANPVLVAKGAFETSGFYIQYFNGNFVLNVNQNGSHQAVTSTAINPTTGTWYNIIFIRNGSAGKVYINGVDQTLSSDALSNPASSSSDLIIGAYVGGSFNFEGDIDETIIVARAITAPEIATISAAAK